MPEVTVENILTSTLPVPNSRERKEICFTNIQPANVGRQNLCDVIRNKPGPAPAAKSTETPIEAFQLFITDEMMQELVSLMNVKIEETIRNIPPHMIESNKYPYVKATDLIEFQAFLGLLLFRGMYNLNNHSIDILFSNQDGLPAFGAAMSRNRFKFLFRNLCFDDSRTREERWSHDRFAAIRYLFEKCNGNFGKCMVPDDFLSIDETLYPMRTQVAFKQYNPMKPAKYGILFKSINSARMPYTYQTHVYCGKPTEEPTDHYVTGTSNYVKYLVQQLEKHHSLSGRNISTDRLYTNFELCDWLFDKKITTVGTLMANRVGIPQAFKETAGKEQLSSSIFWEEGGHKSLNSYIVKTSKGVKNVMILSTMQPIQGITRDDDKKKPALFKLYDFTKGGTDIIDQKMGSYTVKSKSRRWPVVAFSYLFDTARVNANTIHNVNTTPTTAWKFGIELARQLVMPHVRRRSTVGLTQPVLQKIRLFTGENNVSAQVFDNQGEIRKRCRRCLAEISGKDQKVKKDKLPKNRNRCQKCKEPICPMKHTINICNECFK